MRGTGALKFSCRAVMIRRTEQFCLICIKWQFSFSGRNSSSEALWKTDQSECCTLGLLDRPRVSCNISNTGGSVSSGHPNTEKQRSIFDEIQGFWIANETLSGVIYLLYRNKN